MYSSRSPSWVLHEKGSKDEQFENDRITIIHRRIYVRLLLNYRDNFEMKSKEGGGKELLSFF